MIRNLRTLASALLALTAALWGMRAAPAQAWPNLGGVVHVITTPVRVVVQVAQAAATGVQHTAAPAADAAKKVAVAELPVPVLVYKVGVEHEKPGDALKDATKAPGAAVTATAEATSTTLAEQNNLAVTTAGAIAGDPGKTIVTLGTGVNRQTEEFATTTAIQGGEVLQGENPAIFAAAPLATALRSAQKEFGGDAKPIPDDVKVHLASVFTPAQLSNAKYRIAEISISAPDIITHTRKAFGHDYGVTTGNIITFSIDPGTNYHWWTHEIRHTVQYSEWGIDLFALKYITNCHGIESDAENTAQTAFPQQSPTALGC